MLSFNQRLRALIKYTIQTCLLYGLSLITIQKYITPKFLKFFHIQKSRNVSNRIFSVFNSLINAFCFLYLQYAPNQNQTSNSKREYSLLSASLTSLYPFKYGQWNLLEIKYCAPLLSYAIVDLLHLVLTRDKYMLMWIVHHLAMATPLIISILTNQLCCGWAYAMQTDTVVLPLNICWFFSTYRSERLKLNAFFQFVSTLYYVKVRLWNMCIWMIIMVYFIIQNPNKNKNPTKMRKFREFCRKHGQTQAHGQEQERERHLTNKSDNTLNGASKMTRFSLAMCGSIAIMFQIVFSAKLIISTENAIGKWMDSSSQQSTSKHILSAVISKQM